MTETNETNVSKMKLFLKMFTRVPRIKKNAWWLIILLLINVAITVAQPIFYKFFMDNIDFYTKHKALTWDLLWNLWKAALVFFISIVVLILVKFYYRLSVAKLLYLDWRDYLVLLWDSFIRLWVDYHINKNVWEKTKIYDRWSNGLMWWFFSFIIELVPQALIIISLFIFGLFINYKMTLMSFLFLPISFVLLVKVSGLVFKKDKIVGDAWDKSFSRFGDSMTNINIIKIFNKEKQETSILSKWFDNSIDKQFEIEYLWSILMNFLGSFNTVGQILWMIFWTFLVVKWEISIWILFMFVAINSQIYSSFWNIFWNVETIIRNLAHYWKSEEIIAMEKDMDTWNIEEVAFNDNIEFKNVSFNYPTLDREVLKDISFSIEKWQKIALVWHTWSWKSTIVNLLIRFYPVIKWNILLDSTDISSYRLSKYRRKFAQVFQDNTLFNDTILHNLQYINENATFEEIKAACEKAQILDFIESLENKFETVVWERWLKLSGWEKQRIAIARAILANPEVLILDEATSALDSKTENDIQSAFENLMEWRTSIIIAHRLSTIKNVDKKLLNLQRNGGLSEILIHRRII